MESNKVEDKVTFNQKCLKLYTDYTKEIWELSNFEENIEKLVYKEELDEFKFLKEINNDIEEI